MALVYLKNKTNGITYVYESENYWDKSKQQSRSRQVCIGKLDPQTGELIPSKRLAATERSSKRGPVPAMEAKRLYGGAMRFSKWALTHRHPYGKDIPSKRSSDFFAAITEEAREQGRLQGK